MSVATYFDRHHAAMTEVTATEGCRSLCYDRQIAYLGSLTRLGMTILDVGCGPDSAYGLPLGAFVIGLDPSVESIAANRKIDHGIVGTAEQIPLPDEHVDLIVAFYSLHHMTGRDVSETARMRSRALMEMWRVLRPGGDLIVFEVSPRPWASVLQRVFWGAAKWLLGRRLDAFFWTPDDVRAAFSVPFSASTFDCSPSTMLPPAIGLPWLQIPRFLYPFDAVALRWRKEPA